MASTDSDTSGRPVPADRPTERSGAGARQAGPAPAAASPSGQRDPLAGINARTRKRQGILLAALGGTILLAGSIYIFSGTAKPARNDPTQPVTTSISVDAMVGKNMADKAWRAQQEVLTADQNNRLKGLEAQAPKVTDLQTKVADLEQQNAAMRADGAKVVQTYAAMNAEQKAQIEALKKGGAAGQVGPNSEPFRVAGNSPAYGPAGGYNSQGNPSGGPGGTGGAGMPNNGMSNAAEVKTISFGAGGAVVAGGGGASRDPIGFKGEHPDAPPTIIEDSVDYLPPNSYATARVIVGVDASAGVSSQTDPLPVILRITGPARSVVNNGRVLTTRLEGCIVNGAARGDLSAEKIYVKLAKMTCDQPGGRVAVSEVKGFISFGGKTGVRGRVVTREGGLIGQAFLAGIAGGFGRGFSANANAVFQGSQTIIDGKRQQLSPGELAQAGLGQGVAQSADMVSKYLIERAEQYQPVIEMPTGIDVEIVFLDGVYVRGSK